MRSASMRWHRTIVMLVGHIAITSLLIAAAPALAADHPPGLAAVLGELRKGGFVIFFRHAATDQNGSSDEEADPAKCETQRNLSAGGRAQAAQIGEAFRALGIPVGSVTSSPFCRCKDTAKLAFGRFGVNNDLYFAIGANADETRRYTESLRMMLSARPAAATNAIIVSHSANLREAAGLWPKPEGVAYVFRPLSGGRFEVAAMVAPEDWGKLARLKLTSESR